MITFFLSICIFKSNLFKSNQFFKSIYLGAIREAIDALGNIGDTRAIPVLETLLNDSDSSISGRAKMALDKIKRLNSN
jgi:HEAT repeat protein